MSRAKKSGELSAEDAKAQSMLKLQGFIEQMDAAERQSVGTWYNLPPEYAKGWVFIRAGIKRVARAEGFAAQLRQMGYIDAPAGTRCVGFENDGEGGLYLCIPAQGANKITERKMRAKRAVTSAANFSNTLRGLQGGGVDVNVETREHDINVDI
jgi:hypothetical protein